MGIRIHHELDGALAVHPFAFVQNTDPALVADNHVTAFKAWVDTGNGNALKVRNDTNTAWLTVISGSTQAGSAWVMVDTVDEIDDLPFSADWHLLNHI